MEPGGGGGARLPRWKRRWSRAAGEEESRWRTGRGCGTVPFFFFVKTIVRKRELNRVLDFCNFTG